MARNGCYVRREHLQALRSSGRSRDESEEIVLGHTRRLEALRRAGIVERVSDGFWTVPADLVDRGKAYDRARGGDVSLQLHSHLPIEQQIRAIGVTWLDQQLIDGARHTQVNRGFADAVHNALNARLDFLVEQGLAKRRGPETLGVPNLLCTLRARDIDAAANPSSANPDWIALSTPCNATSVSGAYAALDHTHQRTLRDARRRLRLLARAMATGDRKVARPNPYGRHPRRWRELATR